MPIGVVFGCNRSALDPVQGEIHLAMPLLAGSGREIISAGQSKLLEHSAEHFLAESNGWVTAAYCVPIGDSMAETAEAVYRKLFRQAEGNQVVRVWNFVPGINECVDGLENYQAFCLGRHEAFLGHFGERASESYCAASAVGIDGEHLVVIANLTHCRARHLENPLQSPAYEYPERYGPRPPSFSRASYVLGESPALYISGTAAVRGSDSVGLEDLGEQLDVTGKNLDRIIADSVAELGEDIARVGAAVGRAYVRNPEDTDAVLKCIQDNAWCSNENINIAQSDICRKELLVEIELSWPADLA